MLHPLSTLPILLCSLLAAQLSLALGLPNYLTFSHSAAALTIASSASGALPILYDSGDAEALHIAVRTFATDIMKVTGKRPHVFADRLPDGTSAAIIAVTVGSELARRIRRRRRRGGADGQEDEEPKGEDEQGHDMDDVPDPDPLEGQWEAFDARVVPDPLPGVTEALVITGSDRRGTIYGLYTLSEHMGMSPWYFWSDVAVNVHEVVAFPRDAVHAHGPPTVKYRGFHIDGDARMNLRCWWRDYFGLPDDRVQFSAAFYIKVFELLLRLKGNIVWPASAASMFAIDGMDQLPTPPVPGPNQALAERMGVVIGTTSDEPMARNRLEFQLFGRGEWNVHTNGDEMSRYWKYGAERARTCETVYTLGVGEHGDLRLPELEAVIGEQRNILQGIHAEEDIGDIPQVLPAEAVLPSIDTGFTIPEGVTLLFSDDGWGNLKAVPPQSLPLTSGAGLYYHADIDGFHWVPSVSLPKMWYQLRTALSYGMSDLWVLNIGDPKTPDLPLELFLDMAYDADRWPLGSIGHYLQSRAERDFGATDPALGSEIAELLATYSRYTSRRKVEFLDETTFSLIHYNEAETVIADWDQLERRANSVHDALPLKWRTPFVEMVLVQISLMANITRLHVAVAKSNLYAKQGRTAASTHAHAALAAFERDHELIRQFDLLMGSKWKHLLSQKHVGLGPRNALPPVSFVSPWATASNSGRTCQVRIVPENSTESWPRPTAGSNSRTGPNSDIPCLMPMDKFGHKRWIDIASGGPEDVGFTVATSDKWLNVSTEKGRVTGDGTNDTRVWVSIDWEAVSQQNGRSVPGSPMSDIDTEGSITIRCSDGTQVVIAVPVIIVEEPPIGFTGAVMGDGYIAIEAAAFQQSDSREAGWEELPLAGLWASGMTVLPTTRSPTGSGETGVYERWEVGAGPSLTYRFWSTLTDTRLASPGVSGNVDITLLFSLVHNSRSAKPKAIGFQLDNGDIQTLHVGLSSIFNASGNAELSNEVIESSLSVHITPGIHTMTLYAITPGLVLQRIVIDGGGVAARSGSYLGPPASQVL